MDGVDQRAFDDLARSLGASEAAHVGLAVIEGVGVGLAPSGAPIACATADPADLVAEIDQRWSPRWVVWSSDTARQLLALGDGARLGRCWDVAAVHRLLFGGWRADPARAWAALAGLDLDAIPALGQLDLLGLLDQLDRCDGGGAVDDHAADLADERDAGADRAVPVRPDCYLRPEWVAGAWRDGLDRAAAWAALAVAAADRQRARIVERAGPLDDDVARAITTAHAESVAELLAAELEHDGLPIDVAAAEALIVAAIGPRPPDAAAAEVQRRARDRTVLDLVPVSDDIDLRSPLAVRAMLRRLGVDVPDTRASRLEAVRDAHPAVGALLAWRKGERIATTYGWTWLDTNVATDGRLRGTWSACDGAAGRMTAQAGLHNMPAELRPAVAAEPGFALVRADLGQIEPRVLAAVSGDRALARAAAADDLYAPVAARLGVERDVAKVAVLAAMYGQTSGVAGRALAGLDAAYPMAMRYLRDAEEAGVAGRDVWTFGGRCVRMGGVADDLAPEAARAAAAARGRYARNAVVQGAAAELFKRWAVTVRARTRELDATVVLCLHDELLVHAPRERAAAVAELVVACLDEAAARWARGSGVRFVADVCVVERWSDAKR